MSTKNNRHRRIQSFIAAVKKWSLLVVLLILLTLFFVFHLYDYLNLDNIMAYHATAREWTDSHYLKAVMLYLAIFTLLIACGVPCATLLSLLGGFLFAAIGLIYALLGTTLGGLILYSAVRSALGTAIMPISPNWMKKFERGFQHNAFYYLLLLRLVPIFPCWVSNVTAGIMNVPVMTFTAATILGIFPSTLVYVMVGRSLEDVALQGHAFKMQMLLAPAILLPLIGLALLMMAPLVYKIIKKRKPRG